MVAAAALSAAALGLAGCGQKGALYLDPAPTGSAPRATNSNLRPAASSDGTDPLNSPTIEPITPPVIYPAPPTRNP